MGMSSKDSTWTEPIDGLGRWSAAGRWVKSRPCQSFLALVLLLDGLAACVMIDHRAASMTPSPAWVMLSHFCWLVYCGELLLYICLEGFSILRDHLFLFAVVISGLVELVLSAALPHEWLRLFEVVRLLRLLRVFWKLPIPELQNLVKKITFCVKQLMVSFAMCFGVMTLWSMLLVEMVNPLVKQLQDLGAFSDCHRCQRAVSSVMDANLFLFQTVIVGDDWGELAVPLIQTYPATACIFVGSFLTIVFGVLNLIMALVVHSFQDNDRASEVEADRRTLANLFAHLETDQSGQSQVALPQLLSFAQQNPTVQRWLSERDLDDSDLQMLFEMIDWDGRGAIEASDFVSCLSCFAHDSKRTPRFIKYNFMQSMRSQEDLYDLCEDRFRDLTLRIEEVFREVKGLKSDRASSPAWTDTIQTGDKASPDLLLVAEGLTGSALSTGAKEPSDCPRRPKDLVDLGKLGERQELSGSVEQLVAELEASLLKLKERFAPLERCSASSAAPVTVTPGAARTRLRGASVREASKAEDRPRLAQQAEWSLVDKAAGEAERRAEKVKAVMRASGDGDGDREAGEVSETTEAYSF
ncbi:unnamed protein product [Durusdinium trenchii]|uniref:EF-hand domain-containing protein n=1 Tax=Durusdinium trenchii TaxID=1381693 RepID=A0ABP0NIY3_9DINO